jgi:hypothetical protein
MRRNRSAHSQAESMTHTRQVTVRSRVEVRMARRSGRLAWPLILVLGVAAACGAPAYSYVTNSADHTYLRVPASWAALDGKELGLAFGIDPTLDENQGFWLAGYDADASPSTAHLVGPHAPAPAVFVGVRDVPPPARGQISLDVMRDLFRPVSPAARQRVAASPASPFSGFTLIADEVVAPGAGLRGVHSVYRYRIQGGPTQVFDQTVYVNDDASKLYMFFVRCSAECYEDRRQEIESVVSSFTVREGP